MAQRTDSSKGTGPSDRRPVPPVPNAGRAALQGDDRGLSAFSPIRIRRASDEVLAVLVDAIRGGLYEPGDALPPERDLAERLHISRKVLNEVGADMHHIVKFNTFYVFEGEGDEIREYWEKMTAVRLEFFEEPGPVGTAVRISGLAFPDLLIEVEAIAYAPELVGG